MPIDLLEMSLLQSEPYIKQVFCWPGIRALMTLDRYGTDIFCTQYCLEMNFRSINVEDVKQTIKLEWSYINRVYTLLYFDFIVYY